MKRIRWLAVAISLAAAPAKGADLSPGHWPTAERARLEQAELNPYPTRFRTLDGRREMVSATLSPIAVHAGMEALRQGGTAADAAVAVALTQVATNLGSIVSYAGIAELVYYDARTGRVYAMDAGWAPYAGETDPRSIPAADVNVVQGRPAGPVGPPQGRQTLVPGFMAGMAAAHARFGRLPFATLFEPAIWYAENGVPASPLLTSYYGMERPVLDRTPEGRAFLARANDGRPTPGQRIALPGAAALLRGVARQGPSYMYRGAWAKRFVELVQRNGGAATTEDLARYRVIWETPISTHFGDAVVTGPGADNNSACAILPALALLDAMGGPKLPAYWNNPDAFAAYTRAIKTSSAQAYRLPQRPVDDCRQRLTPEFARDVAPQLKTIAAQMEGAAAGHHSAAVVVVDRWGNVAALVHTINAGGLWGGSGIVVDDVPLSNAAGFLQPRIAATPPGSHVAGDMAPLIAMKAGKPIAAVAAIGTSLQGETVRMMAGLLSGADPVALSVAPPLLSARSTPGDVSEPVPERAYSADFRAQAAALGVPIREVPRNRVPFLRGTVAFATIGPDGAPRTAETPVAVGFGEAR